LCQHHSAGAHPLRWRLQSGQAALTELAALQKLGRVASAYCSPLLLFNAARGLH